MLFCELFCLKSRWLEKYLDKGYIFSIDLFFFMGDSIGRSQMPKCIVFNPYKETLFIVCGFDPDRLVYSATVLFLKRSHSFVCADWFSLLSIYE